MPNVLPSAAFARSRLELVRHAPGHSYGRLYSSRHPDPLGVGKGPSRFSDPRRRKPEGLFGVIYLGTSLKVCFVEGSLRDRRNGAISDYPIDETELDTRHYAEITNTRALKLVDLRGDAPLRMGVPSDVIGASRQTLARQWSVAFHEHPEQPDGLLYPSRLNEELNLAIYDRAIPKLAVNRKGTLRRASGLAAVLERLRVALV